MDKKINYTQKITVKNGIYRGTRVIIYLRYYIYKRV